MHMVEDKMEVANISGLRPFTEYAVRIIAVNSVGQGSPSELQLVTTDEDGAHECIINLLKYAYIKLGSEMIDIMSHTFSF